MSISGSKLFFVTHAGKKVEFEKLKFFSLKREKWLDFRASYSALFLEFLQDLGIEEHLQVQENKIHM